MEEKIGGKSLKSETNMASGCCKVEAILGIDERGQMVLPKEVRERAKIKAGDKFALVSMEKDGSVCCITLVKVDELADLIRNVLKPVMKEIIDKEDNDG